MRALLAPRPGAWLSEKASRLQIALIKAAAVDAPGVPLAPAEAFIMALASIPALAQRVRILRYAADFPEAERNLVLAPLADLKRGADEVLTSQALLHSLAIVLAVGNRLNRYGSRSRSRSPSRQACK